MEAIVRDMFAEPSAPPVLVLRDWDAVEDGSRPFRVLCDTNIVGFWRYVHEGAARPLREAHHLCFPPYPRLANTLNFARFGNRKHFLGDQEPSRPTSGLEVSHLLGSLSPEQYRNIRDHNARVSHRVGLHTRVQKGRDNGK